MSLAQQRRATATKKANLYRTLSTGSTFVLLGNLATYPSLTKGCFLVLLLGLLAVNYEVLGAVINQFAKADRLRSEKVQQAISVLLFNASIPLALFIVGGLI